MRRLVSFICASVLLLGVAPALRAQYYSVNIDWKTAAAMQAAYATGAAAEGFYYEQVKDILDHYTAAEAAAAGIFSSKFLERRALTELGIWENSAENWYYRRIYRLVSARIMPKVWTVAKMMLRSPQNALYWGSYLMKICDETKTLCMQFESVVTNSTLSFGDIAFLQIRQDIADYLRLSTLGGIDFEAVLDRFGRIGEGITKEDLKEDMDRLYREGVALIGQGASNLAGQLLQKSSFEDLLSGDIAAAITIVENYQALFEGFKNDAGGTLLSMIGGPEAVGNLFDISDYNLGDWIDDYARETVGQYYRQTWYIRKRDTGENVHEEVFDSYSMDMSSFLARMNIVLASWNDNPDGDVYVLAGSDKNYYQTTDARRVQGVEAATISVTCSGGATLSKGSTQYKCGTCGKTLSAHTKECAMRTSVIEGNVDTSELQSMLAQARAEEDRLNSQILTLQSRNAELLRQISEASIEDAAALREEYNSNRDRIEALQSELRQVQSKIRDIEEALAESGSDDDVPTDDYHRIPAIMAELQSAFSLTWQDAGSWSGYTFRRKATMSGLRGTVTFTAKLSIARKPKYFLGIKILRAIVQIDWTLETEYSDTHVAALVKLDASLSDREKADLVNAKIAEVARQYPSCSISTEYIKSDPVPEDDTDDKYHLLWSSDRLQIAREVDSRLTKIYSDLISLEKMMSYKYGIIEVLRDISPYVNADAGRKMTIAEQCHRDWLMKARLREDDEETTDEP